MAIHANDYPQFSPAEYQRRYDKIRAAMRQSKLDCLLIYGGGLGGRPPYAEQVNARYVSGYCGDACYVIFPLAGEPSLLNLVRSHYPDAKARAVVGDVDWGGRSIAVTVAKKLIEKNLGRGRIGIVGEDWYRDMTIPVSHYFKIKDMLPEAEFVACTELLEGVRSIKSEAEIEAMRTGAAITDRALARLVAAIAPGKMEYEVYGELINEAMRAGGHLVFALIGSAPMSGRGLPYPWYHPRQRRLRQGDIILIKVSIAYLGYSGQLIRPIALGKPTDIYRRLYDTALEAWARVCAALRPGATKQDVVKAAEVILKAGFITQAALIHGWDNKMNMPLLGLKGSEYDEDFVIEAGMTIMIGPSPCTRDLSRGLFFGEPVVVRQHGGERLHQFSQDFVVV